MAAPDALDGELLDALGSVGLEAGTLTFPRLFPRGLDTAVGAGAEELPPEVSQLIALARVALALPKVLILDEAAAADRILVMENGEIIEDGTHDQLLSAKGRYAGLYKAWSG